MEDKEMIKNELAELLETYYNGSFAQLVCGYIHATGMIPKEVEVILEKMKHLEK